MNEGAKSTYFFQEAVLAPFIYKQIILKSPNIVAYNSKGVQRNDNSPGSGLLI